METVSGPVFTENPEDYIGEVVTAEEYQPRHEAREPNGRLARKPSVPEAYRYEGRHRWNVRRRSPRGGAS